MLRQFLPQTLKKLSLFSGLGETEGMALLRQGEPRWYAREQYLFRHGDPILHFYIVCSGAVQLFRETPGGNEITTDIAGCGQALPLTEIFKAPVTVHEVSAFALSDTVVLEYPASWLREAIRNPVIARNVLSAISNYAHMIEVEAEHKNSMTAAQQIACFLQRLCIIHGLDPRGFDLPCSKAVLASRLGMKPETFSRALASLRENGIDITHNRVAFRNLPGMDEYVCGHCSIADDCHPHQAMKRLSKNPEYSC